MLSLSNANVVPMDIDGDGRSDLLHIPEPSAEDIEARVERRPMDARERWAFLRRFAFGLVPLFGVYIASTAFRDFRDNYGVEIFDALGYEGEPGLFTQSELWVAFGVLAVLAALNIVRDNRRGLAGAFIVMIGGAALIGICTALYDARVVDGMTWMILVGLGSYLVYVPFNTVLFDRDAGPGDSGVCHLYRRRARLYGLRGGADLQGLRCSERHPPQFPPRLFIRVLGSRSCPAHGLSRLLLAPQPA